MQGRSWVWRFENCRKTIFFIHLVNWIINNLQLWLLFCFPFLKSYPFTVWKSIETFFYLWICPLSLLWGPILFLLCKYNHCTKPFNKLTQFHAIWVLKYFLVMINISVSKKEISHSNSCRRYCPLFNSNIWKLQVTSN